MYSVYFLSIIAHYEFASFSCNRLRHCIYNVCVLCIVLSLLQNNRMKGIEEQLKLVFTSGIAAALSTSQNSALVLFPFNSLTAATN